MKKNNISLLTALILTLFISSFSFSQDAVTDDRPIVTEDKAADVEGKKEAGAKTAEYASVKAAVYDDGLATYINSRVKYDITATDNALTDKSFFKVNESPEATFEKPFNLETEGKNVITYYSVDKMGNREKDRSMEVTVDNTPPVTMVKSSMPVYKGGEKLFISSTYLFSITSQDNSSGPGTIDYSLDGQTYKPYDASFSITGTGEAVMKVKSSDNVTNTTETFTLILNGTENEPLTVQGNSATLTLDNTAPAVDIKSAMEPKPVDGKNIVNASNKYEISAGDDGSGVATVFYKIDKAEKWIPYTKAIEFSIFGEHRIEAMAVDNVGNASTPVSLTIFIDVVPPDVKDTTAE